MKRTPLKRKTAMKKAAKPKASKIRQSARDEQCTVMVPGVCNGNPETTVLAHLNGAGMGAKDGDQFGAYACSECHSWLDGGYAKHHDRDTRDLLHYRGIIKTQRILFEKGLLLVG